MIIGLEGGICSGKTTLGKLLAEKLNGFLIEEHTQRIKNKDAFNLNFSSISDFQETFDYFLQAEKERNLNINDKNIYIFDRTIHSLIGFAYAKGKLDKLDHFSIAKKEEINKSIKKIDYIFIIKISNKERINRLNSDIERKNITPSLFYSNKFNKYNNEYLDSISHEKKFYINGNDSITNILDFILNTIGNHI